MYYIEGARHDVWTYNVARRIKSPQTFGASVGQSNIFPVWSPDGSRIAYSSYRDGKHAVYQKRADGSAGEELLLEGSDRYRFLTDWSPDGTLIAFSAPIQGGEPGGSLSDVWVVHPDGTGLTAVTDVAGTGGAAVQPTFTPDGRSAVRYTRCVAFLKSAGFAL